jgi:alanyl-tRNA synthetase
VVSRDRYARLPPMATHRLYYDDSYLQSFTAQVCSCLPIAPVMSPSGLRAVWQVLLDRSAFYPDSGGQPHDLGWLGDANILEVRERGDDIVHIVDREVSVGPIEGIIDWPRRFDCMQQHTGQHLLSAMFQGRFGLPTVSFHLGPQTSTIDLRGKEPSVDVLRGAQRAANQVIFEDRPMKVLYDTEDQLARIGVRKEVDREGILRAIEIESADLQPCGGTHVKSTGQIGLLLVRRCSKIRQDWRVEFACGERAERLATTDFQRIQDLSGHLSCSPGQTLAAVERALTERDAHFKSLHAVVHQLAEARAALLVSSTPVSRDGVRVVGEDLQCAHPELIFGLATAVAKHNHTIALIALAESRQLVFAQHSAAGKDLAAVLKQVFAVFPGKGGGTGDFVRGKLADAEKSGLALALAKKLLME